MQRALKKVYWKDDNNLQSAIFIFNFGQHEKLILTVFQFFAMNY